MKKEVILLIIGLLSVLFITDLIRADNYSFNITKLDVRDVYNSYSFIAHGKSNNVPLILDANLSEDYIVTEQQGYRGYLNTKDIQRLQFNNINYSCIGNGQYYRWSWEYNQLTFSLTCSNSNNDNVFVSAYINFKVISDKKNPNGFYNVSEISGYINIINQSSPNQRFMAIKSIQSNQSQRLSLLESWKITLTTIIDAIQTLITGHTTSIDSLNNKTNSQDTRITTLENKPVQNNTNFPNYFKYLSSSDRKAMICGYGQDNHLTSINDLGLNCTITYRISRNNITTSNCKCSGK